MLTEYIHVSDVISHGDDMVLYGIRGNYAGKLSTCANSGYHQVLSAPGFEATLRSLLFAGINFSKF